MLFLFFLEMIKPFQYDPGYYYAIGQKIGIGAYLTSINGNVRLRVGPPPSRLDHPSVVKINEDSGRFSFDFNGSFLRTDESGDFVSTGHFEHIAGFLFEIVKIDNSSRVQIKHINMCLRRAAEVDAGSFKLVMDVCQDIPEEEFYIYKINNIPHDGVGNLNYDHSIDLSVM